MNDGLRWWQDDDGSSLFSFGFWFWCFGGAFIIWGIALFASRCGVAGC